MTSDLSRGSFLSLPSVTHVKVRIVKINHGNAWRQDMMNMIFGWRMFRLNWMIWIVVSMPLYNVMAIMMALELGDCQLCILDVWKQKTYAPPIMAELMQAMRTV